MRKSAKRVHALDSLQVHAAAQAPVAAIRTAEGHEFFAPEAHAAAPAVAGMHFEFGFVDEFHVKTRSAEKKKGDQVLPCSPSFNRSASPSERPRCRAISDTTLT